MFATSTTFSALGISTKTSDFLLQRGITTPTNAQAAVVPILLDGLAMQADYAARVRATDTADAAATENVVEVEGEDADEPVRPQRDADDVNDVLMFGAETGSGKSLAYLLPFVEASARTDVALKMIVLVPSRELCAQTAAFLKQYFPSPPRHMVLAGGSPPSLADMRGVRILIATPTALRNHLRFSKKVDVSDKLIVVDEADMLLSGSFLRDVSALLDQPGMKPFATRRNGELRARNANRLVFVGATYPHWTGERVKSVVTWVRRRYPAVRSVQTAGLHRRNTRLRSRWTYLPSPAERIERVADLLRDEADAEDKVMVFCGKAESAREVHDAVIGRIGREFVQERFGDAVELHKLVDTATRSEGLRRFRDGEARLLFCTDLASRGLDLGDVSRVVEFDFSSNVVGYLHRIGRTARAGASGVTDHFYDDVTRALAEAIREKAENEGSVVEGVFSRSRSFRRKMKKREVEAKAGAEASVREIGEDEIDEMDEEERERWSG